MSNDLKNASWPGWETVGLIGRGSFGAVYEIQRDVLGDVEKAAMKVISIPQNNSDIEEMYNDGYDDESVTSTFRSHLKSIVAEYSLAKKMNGCANIVHCDDVRYIQHADDIGWDVFIKMELLTPLTKALAADIPEDTVIKIARDMCAALELCRKYEIVHRDIKPQNIFVSANGDYKLGDFGIAKTVEKTTGGTKIGTYKYMAPEVYHNQPYGSGADIYSLGLVLYWLLNERRMPFLPLPPAKLGVEMDSTARQRRLSGEEIPAPAHGSEDLKKIVLKACAYKPEDRYASAGAMLHDLNQLDGHGVILPSGSRAEKLHSKTDSAVGRSGFVSMKETEKQEDATVGIFGKKKDKTARNPDEGKEQHVAHPGEDPDRKNDSGGGNNRSPEQPPKSGAGKEKKNPLLKILAVAAVIIIVLLLLLRGCGHDAGQLFAPQTSGTTGAGSLEDVTLAKSSFDLYVGDVVNIEAAGGTGQYHYSSSDESIASVNDEGELTAVGAGTATITVSSGNAAEAACMVTIQSYEMTLSSDSLDLLADATETLEISGIPEGAQIEWSSGDSNVATVDENGVVTAVDAGETTITATWKNGNHSYTAEIVVTVESQGVSLDTQEIPSIYVGETYAITASTSPADQTLTWTSSNEAVATVSPDGVVTAVGSGTCTITASFDSFSESCSVTVTLPSVELAEGNVSLFVGESTTLSATVAPDGTELTWRSDDSNVATVDGGNITAVGAGTTTIRAQMTYAGKTYEAVCAVTVSSPSVTLSAGSLSLTPGQSSTLRATTTPSGAGITWSSSNTGVATVSNGTVTAVGYGEAQITAQITYNGKTYTATCYVTVARPSISVTSSSSTITYAEREIDRGTCVLTANVTPSGGTVTWRSSDTSVATVSGNGRQATVTAQSSGTATITATYSVDGTTVTDTCTITVKKAASTLRVDNFSYAQSGTVDSFWVSGTISSNYALTRVECIGTATSNALGITVGGDTTTPYYFSGQQYEIDASVLTSYFIEQYRSLYNLYAAVAGLLGADQSVTMNITVTCYDSSGNSQSRSLTYIIYS